MTARIVISLAAVAALLAGCATKKYVSAEVGASEARSAEMVESLSGRVEENQQQLAEHEVRLEQISGTAREALDRAVAAGKLAEGRFLYEVVLSDDKVRFDFDRADLGDEARVALDGFAEELRNANRDVYVEIQGHTDAIGEEEYNLRLGERRAEAVRRYLNAEWQLALHRMAVVSYGETAPVADNGDSDGRALNRRVTLVVLE